MKNILTFDKPISTSALNMMIQSLDKSNIEYLYHGVSRHGDWVSHIEFWFNHESDAVAFKLENM